MQLGHKSFYLVLSHYPLALYANKLSLWEITNVSRATKTTLKPSILGYWDHNIRNFVPSRHFATLHLVRQNGSDDEMI